MVSKKSVASQKALPILAPVQAPKDSLPALPQAAEVRPPYEYASSSIPQPVTDREPTCIRSDISQQVGPSSVTTDLSFASSPYVLQDSILQSVAIAAGWLSTAGIPTHPSMLSLKIYRGADLIYELPIMMGQNQTCFAVVDQPNLVLKAGDVPKFGRYFNLAAGNELYFCATLNLQPFR